MKYKFDLLWSRSKCPAARPRRPSRPSAPSKPTRKTSENDLISSIDTRSSLYQHHAVAWLADRRPRQALGQAAERIRERDEDLIPVPGNATRAAVSIRKTISVETLRSLLPLVPDHCHAWCSRRDQRCAGRLRVGSGCASGGAVVERRPDRSGRTGLTTGGAGGDATGWWFRWWFTMASGIGAAAAGKAQEDRHWA
jgi:hypothetical protein